MRVSIRGLQLIFSLPSRLAFVISAFALISACAGATEVHGTPTHIFILAGQSNMAGRGELDTSVAEPHPRVLVLNARMQWQPAVDPLHWDKPAIAGVGPGLAFGESLAADSPEMIIGLVPTAVGGSSIDAWVPGGLHEQTGTYPWDVAADAIAVAAAAGKLEAVLWHQGESDANDESAAEYRAKLARLIQRFRCEANDATLLFLIGQLGMFDEWSPAKRRINEAHESIAEYVANTGFVPSDGLTHIGDRTHFDATSARELGRRFADTYLQIRSHPLPEPPVAETCGRSF